MTLRACFVAAGIVLSCAGMESSARAADLPYATSFDGADGTLWPAPWFAGSAFVTVSDVQGNRGRLNGGQTRVARMILPGYSEIPPGIAEPPPRTLVLSAPVPHPIAGPTALQMGLPRPGNAQLGVYDLAGRRVARPFAGSLPAGRTRLSWTPKSSDGGGLHPGVYFLKLESGGQVATRRIVIAD